jgi:hypothetical protein
MFILNPGTVQTVALVGSSAPALRLVTWRFLWTGKARPLPPHDDLDLKKNYGVVNGLAVFTYTDLMTEVGRPSGCTGARAYP